MTRKRLDEVWIPGDLFRSSVQLIMNEVGSCCSESSSEGLPLLLQTLAILGKSHSASFLISSTYCVRVTLACERLKDGETMLTSKGPQPPTHTQ